MEWAGRDYASGSVIPPAAHGKTLMAPRAHDNSLYVSPATDKAGVNKIQVSYSERVVSKNVNRTHKNS